MTLLPSTQQALELGEGDSKRAQPMFLWPWEGGTCLGRVLLDTRWESKSIPFPPSLEFYRKVLERLLPVILIAVSFFVVVTVPLPGEYFPS